MYVHNCDCCVLHSHEQLGACYVLIDLLNDNMLTQIASLILKDLFTLSSHYKQKIR